MTETKLLVISQAISVAFLQWLQAFAQEYGPVELWTGSSFAASSETLRVRHLTSYNKDSYRTRLIAWIRFSLSVMIVLMLSPRRIPVLAITNPPFMPLILVLHRVLFGRRFGIIEYDIYPQIMETMGIIGSSNPVHRIWWRWHAWSLDRSELVVAISPQMAAELRSMVKRADMNVMVVPNWTDTERFKPIPSEHNAFVQEYHLADKLVVTYAGNLGQTHAIETIIDVAAMLADQDSIEFLIIGDGAKRKLVEQAITMGRTPNLLLLPLLPAREFPTALASADIAFVTLSDGYERLSMPTKTYETMACGCVIIGISAEGSGIAQVIQDHACGKNFRPDEADEIASWILELAHNRTHIRELQQAARKAAVEHFSAERCGSDLSAAVVTQLFLSPIRANAIGQ